MPLSEYEWIIAMALTWSGPEEVAEPAKWPLMELVESVGGQLGPNDWSGSNDDAYTACLLALIWLLMCAKSHVILLARAEYCAN